MNAVIYVRPLTYEDVSAYLAMFSPLIRSTLQVHSLQEEHEYVIVHLEQQKHGMTFFYGIFLSVTQQLIGVIEIRDRKAYRGQLYCWVNEQSWGTGYFTQAMRLVATAYFSQTTQLYFNAFVATSNKRSYKALKKCGFLDSGFYRGVDGDSYELMLRRKILIIS